VEAETMNEWHDIPSSLMQSRRSRARAADPIVYEDGESITLQFLIGEIQSETYASDPTALVLTYTRTMAAFTSFHRKPKHIAIIGLGGGSLPKWCYHHLPQSEITVVEFNPKVIALRKRFMVPPDCERFRVLCADGADYVSTTSDSPDVLLVDGFDIYGQPPELCSQDFYDNCYRTLREDGLLVVNICDHRHQREMLARIRGSFGDRVIGVTPEPGENTIVFATKGEQLQPSAVLSPQTLKSLLPSSVLSPELLLA
jgi:spermidine synthase